MQLLTKKEIAYFKDPKNWQSGPSFHAIFVQRSSMPIGRFTNALVSDKLILSWNLMADSKPKRRVKHFIVVDPNLTHPIGIKVFERKYDKFLTTYISIPPHHVGRICGQDWVYGRYDLDRMVELHDVIIRLSLRIYENCEFSTLILMDETWSWPTKLENLQDGVWVNDKIASHAGWKIRRILPTNYALIPFTHWDCSEVSGT